MNAARLARRLEEAGDNRTRWAEAICDEILDSRTGLVTKGYLDQRLAELNAQLARQEAERMRRILVLTQIVTFGALAALILLK